MGVCDVRTIKRNIKRCNQKPLVKGVDELIRLGMKDEQGIIFSFDPDNDTIVTGIVLDLGKKLYAYEGNNFSNDFSVGFAESDYDKTLPQTGVIVIFSNSPETKQEIQALLTRKDLIIISKRVNGPFEIFGAETGMRVTGFKYRPNDDDKGAFFVTLTAADETGLPKTLIHEGAGGLEDTKTYLDGLTAPDL